MASEATIYVAETMIVSRGVRNLVLFKTNYVIWSAGVLSAA